MKVLSREFHYESRSEVYRLYPIGDIHIGAAACDEKRLKQIVEVVKGDDRGYWVGLGDYCDFINRSDPRFNAATVAGWFRVADLNDIAAAQRDRLLNYLRPIAGKCLALVCGNHETAIMKHYERDIYHDIVTAIKEMGGFEPDHKLAIGYAGWLRLKFYRSEKRQRGTRYDIALHHGHGGGKLAGGKALNMQRWLLTHDCDLALMGHNHDTQVIPVAAEVLDKAGKVYLKNRLGAWTGSFLRGFIENGPSTYGEVKGYLPLAPTNIMVSLMPAARNFEDRLRVTVGI